MKPAIILSAALALAGCSSASSDNRAEAMAAAKQLPPAFLGRWGITPADCDFSRSDTKGLLTVFADRLSFHESTARIDSLERRSPYRIVAALTLTGDGRTWQRRDTLDLASAGTILVRTEPSAAYRYERC